MAIAKRVLAMCTMVLLCSNTHRVAAAEFDRYGAAPSDLVKPAPSPDIIVELGGGLDYGAAYEGASAQSLGFMPLFRLDRLNIPGLIDIDNRQWHEGFYVAPSFDFVPERDSADYAALTGLDNVGLTVALGGRAGYKLAMTETIDADIYGDLRYAFGGAHGFAGEVGADITDHLTPQLDVTVGPVISFASADYMNSYFGVTAAESVATGGRLAAYNASGGIKSGGIKASIRYEFMPDTFVTLNGLYATMLDAAADPRSPKPAAPTILPSALACRESFRSATEVRVRGTGRESLMGRRGCPSDCTAGAVGNDRRGPIAKSPTRGTSWPAVDQFRIAWVEPFDEATHRKAFGVDEALHRRVGEIGGDPHLLAGA